MLQFGMQGTASVLAPGQRDVMSGLVSVRLTGESPTVPQCVKRLGVASVRSFSSVKLTAVA